MYVAPRIPITVDTASKGAVALQHLTFGNLRRMWDLEKNRTNDWDFMVTSLQLHITDPVTSLADFQAWDRADIERIAREWAANDQVFGKPLSGSNVSQAFVEAFKAAPQTWARDLKEIAKNALKILGEHQAIFRKELLQIGPGAAAFQTHLAELTRPLFEDLRQLPAQLRDAHGKLAQQGWYMDPIAPPISLDRRLDYL